MLYFQPETSAKRRLIPLTIAIAASLVTSNAFAQSHQAERSFGLQLHASEVSVNTSQTWNEGLSNQTWGNEPGFGVSASYYLDPSISLRATYERANSFTSMTTEFIPDTSLVIDRDNNATAEHFSIALVPQFDISPSLFGFAHVGIARNEVSSTADAPKFTETSVVYGFGIGLRLTDNVSLASEYSRTGSNYEALRVSIGYRF